MVPLLWRQSKRTKERSAAASIAAGRSPHCVVGAFTRSAPLHPASAKLDSRLRREINLASGEAAPPQHPPLRSTPRRLRRRPEMVTLTCVRVAGFCSMMNGEFRCAELLFTNEFSQVRFPTCSGEITLARPPQRQSLIPLRGSRSLPKQFVPPQCKGIASLRCHSLCNLEAAPSFLASLRPPGGGLRSRCVAGRDAVLNGHSDFRLGTKTGGPVRSLASLGRSAFPLRSGERSGLRRARTPVAYSPVAHRRKPQPLGPRVHPQVIDEPNLSSFQHWGYTIPTALFHCTGNGVAKRTSARRDSSKLDEVERIRQTESE